MKGTIEEEAPCELVGSLEIFIFSHVTSVLQYFEPKASEAVGRLLGR